MYNIITKTYFVGKTQGENDEKRFYFFVVVRFDHFVVGR